MAQLNTWGMTGNPETFRQAATAWAKGSLLVPTANWLL